MDIRDLLSQPREVLERFCESRTKYAYLGGREGLARVLGKYSMYVDPKDTSLAPHFILDGYWEAWVTLALIDLPRGIACADVGANHGYFSLLFADLSESNVYSFEPQHHLAELLQKTANVNGFRNTIKVIEAAVGEKAGVAVLEKPPGEPNNTGSVWCVDGPKLGDAESTEVRVVSLDETVEEPLGFVKIDAEGFEPMVWAGMKRHLESKPTILMEFTPSRYEDAEGFLQEIASCYTLREVDPAHGVVPVEPEKVLEHEDFTMLWLEAD